jgi:hypothetical protein
MGTHQWTAIAFVSGLLGIVSGAEWLVTYCAFSDLCPVAMQLADLTVR